MKPGSGHDADAQTVWIYLSPFMGARTDNPCKARIVSKVRNKVDEVAIEDLPALGNQ